MTIVALLILKSIDVPKINCSNLYYLTNILYPGRINLVELSKTLKVDLSHVSARIPEVEKSEAGCTIILGQLINRTYQQTIAEEINDSLQRLGQITISELTKTYDLPGEFLLSVSQKYIFLLYKIQHAYIFLINFLPYFVTNVMVFSSRKAANVNIYEEMYI